VAFVEGKKEEAQRKYRSSSKYATTRSTWYKNNRAKQQARVKVWTEANQQRLKSWRREYYQKNKLMLSLRSTKAGATRRGLEYSLPDALAKDLMTDACFYCGDYSQLNGIDRVDNTKGYVESNVVTACKACNRAKHARTRAEFEDWAQRLAANLSRWQPKAA
jgi:hypothetical protein